ncbi:MAG: tRNA threonylcarbamoyladenosine dehydratase [Deltaproteobacteria bacterium]|nr:tRNA threonylcarbamoyladenosine dehydratase [Deltaproteobacteria bacterium]
MPLPMADTSPASTSVHAEPAHKTHRRFDRAARLFTEPGLHRLMSARVMIFGMGGVGSFAAEALARSAVGTLGLVDFDDVCVTNTNRQLHAMKGNVGKAKAEIMAERLRLISPTSTIVPVLEFYEATKADTHLGDAVLGGPIDFVVDAIDSISAKAHLLSQCLARGIPVVSSMGAAGRLDPTRVRVSDLADTEGCGLARDVRGILRKQYGLAVERGTATGITAVFSDEQQAVPAPISYDDGQGFVCVCPNKDNGVYTCDKRARIDGSASFVTGTFGLAAASVVVRVLTAEDRAAHARAVDEAVAAKATLKR